MGKRTQIPNPEPCIRPRRSDWSNTFAKHDGHRAVAAITLKAACCCWFRYGLKSLRAFGLYPVTKHLRSRFKTVEGGETLYPLGSPCL
jgi:hypothetical protein